MAHASARRPEDEKYNQMSRVQLIDEIHKKDRKRQYHYERFQHYRSRMTNIMRDADNLITWYTAFINEHSLDSQIPEDMCDNIHAFQHVLASEISCSVCGKPVGDNMRECLVPRCAHMIHTGHNGVMSCYERLRSDAKASRSKFSCPVCDEELPLYAS